MEGKVVVVTGGNSGIGKATCEQVASLGARVVLVCRNEQKGQEAIAELKAKTGREAFDLVLADLSEMSQVRRAARELRARHPKLDVLVNNAGVYLPSRHVTSEGLEAMFALNHLGAFLLTHELLEPLAAAGSARVITVSSAGHVGGKIDFEDLQMERSWNGLKQYCNTKLANVLFTRALAKRLQPRGMVAHAYHPGAVRTGFAQDEPGLFGFVVRAVSPFLRTADKAARTATFLSSSPEAARSSGDYFIDSRRRRPSRAARNDELAQRLWEVSAELAGVAAD